MFRYKNKKILRYFIEKMNLNLNNIISTNIFMHTSDKSNNLILPSAISNDQDVLEVLLTEVNFSYKVKIDVSLYNYMNYNFDFQFKCGGDGNESSIEMQFINNVSN